MLALPNHLPSPILSISSPETSIGARLQCFKRTHPLIESWTEGNGVEEW
jgi:hypothetical protein